MLIMSPIMKLSYFRVGLAIVVLQLCLISMATAAPAEVIKEEELFRQYKPIAMDESWALVKNRAPLSEQGVVTSPTTLNDTETPITNQSIPESKDAARNEFDELTTKAEEKAKQGREEASGIVNNADLPTGDSSPRRKSSHRLIFTADPSEVPVDSTAPAEMATVAPVLPPILDIETSDNVNMTENLFALPKVETPRLTQAISSGQHPTFVHEDVVRPVLSRNKSSRVLASYRILVPIYIPAVRSPTKRIIVDKPEVKYIKETHTEMVPVKKTVPRVKTVYKAEPLPQEIVTDFVREVPNYSPSSSDQAGTSEQLIKSTVTTV